MSEVLSEISSHANFKWKIPDENKWRGGIFLMSVNRAIGIPRNYSLVKELSRRIGRLIVTNGENRADGASFACGGFGIVFMLQSA